MKLKRSYPYLLTLPALITIGIVLIYPLLYSFGISFFKWTLSSLPPYPFIGLKNYIRILGSSLFRQILKQNILFAFGCVSVEFFIGFGIALILNVKFKGQHLFRILFLIPMLMAPVLVGYNWRWLLNTDYGLINQILIRIGLTPKLWLVDKNLAMLSIMIADIWQYTPFCTLLLLAGLQSLPPSLYEAASIDGATRWKSFIHLTLPLLKTVIFIVLILRIIDLFRVFDIVYIMTRGGPGGATDLLPTYVYRVTFRELRFGYGSALSYITLLISLVLILPLLIKIEE